MKDWTKHSKTVKTEAVVCCMEFWKIMRYKYTISATHNAGESLQVKNQEALAEPGHGSNHHDRNQKKNMTWRPTTWQEAIHVRRADRRKALGTQRLPHQSPAGRPC